MGELRRGEGTDMDEGLELFRRGAETRTGWEPKGKVHATDVTCWKKKKGAYHAVGAVFGRGEGRGGCGMVSGGGAMERLPLGEPGRVGSETPPGCFLPAIVAEWRAWRRLDPCQASTRRLREPFWQKKNAGVGP